MGLFDQLSSVLQQYANSTGTGQVNPQVNEHFDQVAQAAPSGTLADGLAAAFRSNNTPAFGQMLGSMFNQSNGEQKAGILNQLLASGGPGLPLKRYRHADTGRQSGEGGDVDGGDGSC